MSNFLLMPFGSSGDTHPFLGIGRELLRRGHAVSVQTNSYFKPVVERADLEYCELGTGEEYLKSLQNPDIWDPRKGFKTIIDNTYMPLAIRGQYALIAERLKLDPNLTVLAGSLAMGARIAEEKLGVRLVSVHLQPMMFFSVKNPPTAPMGRIPDWMPRSLVRFAYWYGDTRVYGPIIGKLIEPFRRELGLPKATNYLREWLHSQTLELALFPKWFANEEDWPGQLRQTGFPLFDDGQDKPLAPELEAYLAAGEPPLVFTFGSGMRRGERVFAASAEACERLGRRGILLTPFREQLPAKLPAHATHFDYIPLARLLPRTAGIVHHGGIGTTAQALKAGVPQLITPMSHDQFDNAARVVKLGVAKAIPALKVTGLTLAAQLLQLIENPLVGVKCKDAARRFENHDAITETCDMLEAFSKSGLAPSV